MMAATSCFVNAFKSMNNEHEGHTVSAEDLILNMVIPTSIAGELHEEAIQKYKEEQSMRHIHHRLLQDIQLSAGSSSDGLSLPEVTIKKGDIYVTEGADVDIMYLFTSLVVDSGNRRAFCSTDSSNSPHGYTRLVFNTEWLEKRPSKNHREMTEEQMIKGAYPSFIDSAQNLEINRNKLFRLLQSFLHGTLHNPAMERRLTNYNLSDERQFPELSYSRHGPAITVENTKFDNPHSKVWTSKDYVISLPCPRWPNEAAEWVTRPRLWPPKSLVRRIVKTGCLIVAKQDKEVQDHRSFLFSFSQCEKLLALNLTVLQKRCYLLFKFLFKYSINKVARGMCSFHCKTIFFRRCEVTTPDMWTDNNLLECVTWLLSDMEGYLKSGCLPQYFIAGMNLFSAISQKARESILNDVAKVLASPVRTILDLVDTRVFCWKSMDISLNKIVSPVCKCEILTKELVQQTIVDFVSELLDKGEVDVAVSILCGTNNVQCMPPTKVIIDNIECALKTGIGRSSITLKGLLATLLHEKALECLQDNVECVCNGNFMERSVALFEDIITHVGKHIWIASEYFNYLFNSEQYGKLVQYFLTMLDDGYLFTGGIYTNISSHNILAVDPEIREAAQITIPSLVYISYKAIMACSAIASDAEERTEINIKMNITHLARKILRNLSTWFKNKVNMYPEDYDEHIHLLLGLCYQALGDDKHFEHHFSVAEAENCTYGDMGDDLMLMPRLTDNVKNAQMKLNKPKRYHPYKSIEKQQKRLKSDIIGKVVKIRRFILNPFIHRT